MNFTHIASKLYDPAHIGAIAVNSFIQAEERQKLICEIDTAKELFRQFPKRYGNALQDLQSFYIGSADEKRSQSIIAPQLYALFERMQSFHQQLGNAAGFYGAFTSLGIHKYATGTVGLTPHYDHTKFRNVIATVILEGQAEFGICAVPFNSAATLEERLKLKESAVLLHAIPGSLVLMRAPRNQQENSLRPLHFVGQIQQERTALIFREKVD